MLAAGLMLLAIGLMVWAISSARVAEQSAQHVMRLQAPPPAPTSTPAHVQCARALLEQEFPAINNVVDAGTEVEDDGIALDFYVGDLDEGERFVRHVLARRDQLSVNYVIWRQRVAIDGQWFTMRSRGGLHANHFDRVHLSFRSDSELECEGNDG